MKMECIIEYMQREIKSYAYSEQRELKEINILQTVKSIGAHAFYNCRNLRKISLYDGIVDIGDGAFKNCYLLKEIDIVRITNHTKTLKGILSEVNNELTVTIHYNDGISKLIFPYYLYNYEENTPARIVNQITEGSGIQYRECIMGEDIDYVQYDKLFESGQHIDILDSAWKIACVRLKYPYKLSNTAKQQYTSYLEKECVHLINNMVELEKLNELKMLLDMDICSQDNLKECIDNARANAQMEGLGILLAYQKEKYGTVRKKFEW